MLAGRRSIEKGTERERERGGTEVMCAITLDAHNRDVQERLVRDKVTSADAFQWQSMLKSYWILDEEHEANAQMHL